MSLPDDAASRHFDFRLGLGIPLLLMTLLLFSDPSSLDFRLAHFFFVPDQGFVGQHSYWLEDVLHDRAKQVVIAFALLVLAGFLLSLLFSRWNSWRRPFGYLVLAMSLSTAIVTPLKTVTAIQCPWSLNEFGGTETYVPLLGVHPETTHPGRCWPGGHASTGFSLLALFFCLRDRRPRAARIALGVALAAGTVFSIGRMMQGAHFLSHNLWTLLIDWTVCVLCYRWMLYQRPASKASDTLAAASPSRACSAPSAPAIRASGFQQGLRRS